MPSAYQIEDVMDVGWINPLTLTDIPHNAHSAQATGFDFPFAKTGYCRFSTYNWLSAKHSIETL